VLSAAMPSPRPGMAVVAPACTSTAPATAAASIVTVMSLSRVTAAYPPGSGETRSRVPGPGRTRDGAFDILGGLKTPANRLRIMTMSSSSESPLPPAARRIPRERTFHGDTFADEYAWLEEKDNPETIAFLEGERLHRGDDRRPGGSARGH